jgi:hypothetical protein
MRVVSVYGMHRPTPPPNVRLPGAEQETQKREEPVIIIHKGTSRPDGIEGITAGNEGVGGAQAPAARDRSGIPVPGTDYQLVTDPDAVRRGQSVEAHEQNHRLALGPYAASGISYTTRRGPDGERVATGGSIKADLSPVPGNPQATLRKANAVRRAALAPGDPSSADMRVAADAYRLAQQAREDLNARHTDISV